MTTILIEENIDLTRNEGDKAMLRFRVPDIVNMDGKYIRFHVYSRTGRLVFKKEGEEWTTVGQIISCSMVAEDTKGNPGSHKWEMQVNDQGDDPITIGRGRFTVSSELIV